MLWRLYRRRDRSNSNCIVKENDIKYIYIFTEYQGIKWGQVTTSNYFNYYNSKFMGQLQQRPATDAETMEYIKYDIERM